MPKTIQTSQSCSSITLGDSLEFIGQVPCPLKGLFTRGYNEVALAYKKQTGKSFYSYVPTVCKNDGSKEKPNPGKVLDSLSIDDFPNLVASFSLGDYFCSQFRDKFQGKGYFETLHRDTVNPDFTDLGIDDPKGEFFIYSGYPIIFLIDNRKLGDLPVPRSWEDLLNPIYKEKITMGGGHGRISPTSLLYLHKLYGDEGLKKYEQNIKQAVHPSEMAKLAGSPSRNGTAIYVLTWFWGRACGKTDSTQLIWPEEGAGIDPAFLLVKKGAAQDYKVLIDYIAGEKFGHASAKNGYPVTHPSVDNALPKGAKMNWLGWDYIYSHNMEELSEHVTERFQHFTEQ